MSYLTRLFLLKIKAKAACENLYSSFHLRDSDTNMLQIKEFHPLYEDTKKRD